MTAANGHARVEYAGVTEARADTLLRAPGDYEQKSAMREAMEFLRGELKDGPVAANAIKERAGKQGISDATLRRAKADLRVDSRKQGDGAWVWQLAGKASGKALT